MTWWWYGFTGIQLQKFVSKICLRAAFLLLKRNLFSYFPRQELRKNHQNLSFRITVIFLICRPNIITFDIVVIWIYRYTIAKFIDWYVVQTDKKTVDGTLESKIIQSQISIVTAARMYVAARKSSKQFQTPLKLLHPCRVTGNLFPCDNYAKF